MKQTKRIIIFLCVLLCLVSSCGGGNSDLTDNTPHDIAINKPNTPSVKLIDTCNLTMYYPSYSTIDLCCGKMPSKEDSNVILIAEAAFTSKCLNDFTHSNICGSHTSGGVFYKNSIEKRLTGGFVFKNNKPEFFYLENSDSILENAAKNGGMGFVQEMLIHNGKIVKHTRPDNNTNEFRALCLIDGTVAISDSKGSVQFGDFIDNLISAGVVEALYLDMGIGWNYSWYRNEDGDLTEIHNTPTEYASNWITFYK